MRKYIVVNTKTHQQRMVEDPNFDGRWHERYFPGTTDRFDVEAYTIDGTDPSGKIWYNEELVSSAGMCFTIFVPPTATPADAAAARSWLRIQRDVVSIRTVKLRLGYDTPPPLHSTSVNSGT